MSYAVSAPVASPLGDGVPTLTPHAVSVSLPTWKDNVDYEEGAPRVHGAMKCGYPRFFVHPLIRKLVDVTIARYGSPDESAILLPTAKIADACRDFLATLKPPVSNRVEAFPIKSADGKGSLTIFACIVKQSEYPAVKQFWQHTGDGISSRRAERALTLLGEMDAAEQDDSKAFCARVGGKSGRYSNNRYGSTSTLPPALNDIPNLPVAKSRYNRATPLARRPSQSDGSDPPSMTASIDSLTSPRANSNGFTPIEQEEDVLSRYVEERYGRNLDLSLAPLAKVAMRRRIAGVLRETPGQAVAPENLEQSQQKDSDRGVTGLTEDGVWMYPTGMSAIWHAHQLAMLTAKREGKQVGKSVCFGFPYTDTLKILEKWGPGCHFLGHGLTSDLPQLRQLCEDATIPIVALFCEFPSNPLLRSPPLHELRKLADEFGFFIVIDETIANFVNVQVLPLADIVVSSLTKVFSGDCNVMGGSLVINPQSKRYAALRAVQDEEYEDAYFDEDAIYMERNSRDFQERVGLMNTATEAVCEHLRSRRAHGPVPEGLLSTTPSSRPSVIKDVYYPKYMTPANYESCLRPAVSGIPHTSGYGALFSVTFTSLAASKAFFDALPCYKGPSLGTNFTLACPYTILAHYTELPWALDWGVDEGLIRMSIGLEEIDLLKEWMDIALDAAEKAVEAEK